MPRVLGTEDGQYVDALEVADAFEGVDDLLAFFLKLSFIGQVLELAAAATVVDRAGRRDAVRRGHFDDLEGRRGIGLLDQYHRSLYVFTGQCVGNEDRKAFVFPDAFTARAEAVDMYSIGLPFGNGDRSVWIHSFSFQSVIISLTTGSLWASS